MAGRIGAQIDAFSLYQIDMHRSVWVNADNVTNKRYVVSIAMRHSWKEASRRRRASL